MATIPEDAWDAPGVPGLSFARALRPTEKLTALAESELPAWAHDREPPGIEVLVEFFPDVERATARRELDRVGLRGTPYGGSIWRTVASRPQLQRLAEHPAVRRIEPGPPPADPLNQHARGQVRTDIVQLGSSAQPPSYLVSGKGIRLGICDTGVSPAHPDLERPRLEGPAQTRNKHGTHVASIAAGAGINSPASAPYSLRGHAPEATIVAQKRLGGDVAKFHDSIVKQRVDVTNHSYSQSCARYDYVAHNLDLLVHGTATHKSDAIPARPQVWAAGNNAIWFQWPSCRKYGVSSVFTTAKNTISVGSVDTVSGARSSFSSLGPTLDGRIKPDVVAPGCRDSADENTGIEAADGWTEGYRLMCGTSMAAPAVTAIIGLTMEIADAAYGQHDLRPSTYKAILVNSAQDMTTEAALPDPKLPQPGPDPATGYGLVRAERAAETMTSDGWEEGTINATGKESVYCIDLPENAVDLRVTLAWDDVPYCPWDDPTQRALVNDLDLELVDPNGNSALPWSFDPALGQATRAANHVDNVERVDVPKPAAKVWKIRVRGHDLPFGTSQHFSLASSARFIPCPLEAYPPAETDDVCAVAPGLCEAEFEAFATPVDGRWEARSEQVLDVDRIANRDLDVPACGGKAWKTCPEWTLVLHGVPPDAAVLVVNDARRVVHQDRTRREKRKLPVVRRPGERYFVFFVTPSRSPYREPFQLRLSARKGA